MQTRIEKKSNWTIPLHDSLARLPCTIPLHDSLAKLSCTTTLHDSAPQMDTPAATPQKLTLERGSSVRFAITSGTHTHFFAADSDEDAQAWVSEIQQAWRHCVLHPERTVGGLAADEKV